MDSHVWTRFIIDALCIFFLFGLAWMWVIGQIVDDFLHKRKEKRKLEERIRTIHKRNEELKRDKKAI